MNRKDIVPGLMELAIHGNHEMASLSREVWELPTGEAVRLFLRVSSRQCCVGLSNLSGHQNPRRCAGMLIAGPTLELPMVTGEVWEVALLTRSQVLLMLLVWGPHFENHSCERNYRRASH